MEEASNVPPASPPASWGTRESTPQEAAFYGADTTVFTPSNYDELTEMVRFAEAKARPLIPAGLGTHAYLGNPPPADAIVVSMGNLNKVLRYEPDDFTMGVQAGARLTDLRTQLRKNHQALPVDFSTSAEGTIGSLVATARPGPRLGHLGPVRSAVIGVHGLRGGPSRYKSGGMVVKNVAGYEIAKLLCGSFGTAGFLLEVNFKLQPTPESRGARIASFPEAAEAWEFVRRVRGTQVAPSFLQVLSAGTAEDLSERVAGARLEESLPSVAWLFEGGEANVAWQEKEMDALLGSLGKGLPAKASAALGAETVDGLLDFLCAFSEPGSEVPANEAIVRLGTLPTAAVELESKIHETIAPHAVRTATDALTGLVTCRWSGGEPDDLLARVNGLAGVAGDLSASGVLLYLPPSVRSEAEYFLSPDPNADLARRILKVFDPAGVFAPGRLHRCESTSP